MTSRRPAAASLAAAPSAARALLLLALGLPCGVCRGGSAVPEPPVPRGFESTGEVEAAIRAGRVRLIPLALATGADVAVKRAVEYGHGGGRPLELDLYSPKAAPTNPAPGLILIHGGGWRGGRREMYHYYGVQFARRGYVAATISYRLSGESPFPAAVQDAKCAVRWMRTHAPELAVDSDRIAVLGGSAGGHLALMVGYAQDPDLEGDGGCPGASSRVQAVVSLYGPTDLTAAAARANRMVTDFLGGRAFHEDPQLFARASPLHHLTPDDPPTLLLHGTIDQVVSVAQSDTLARKLAGLGVPVAYVRYEGWPHVMDLALEVNEHCLWTIDRFLREHLGGGRSTAGRPRHR